MHTDKHLQIQIVAPVRKVKTQFNFFGGISSSKYLLFSQIPN